MAMQFMTLVVKVVVKKLLFIGDFTAKMLTFKHAPHRHNAESN
jgi:hypothetical protein